VVWPTNSGDDGLHLLLRSDNGTATFWLPRSALAVFLHLTQVVVPSGTEQLLTLDRELQELFPDT
jgi:Streptomyces sporulation and cell division protein, SsgA